MGYKVHCSSCGSINGAGNILKLMNRHIDELGRLRCIKCRSTDAYIPMVSELQEPGRVWRRFVKGVVRIPTSSPTYSPFVFLCADVAGGQVRAFHFNYYKDTRPLGGRLKQGHGPGGAPVLRRKELFHLLEQLGNLGAITPGNLRKVAKRIQRQGAG
jgi:hypothetical protein